MRLCVPLLSLLMLTTIACGRAPAKKETKENAPVDPKDEEIPAPKKDRTPPKDGKGGGKPPNNGGGTADKDCPSGKSDKPFSGSIADLRKSDRKTGTKVTLKGVVTTAISGSFSPIWVMDAESHEYGGIQVRCGKDECKVKPQLIGEVVDIEGTYALSGDCTNAGIIKPTFKLVGSTATVEPLLVDANKLTKDAESAPYRGSKVKVKGNSFEVTNARPEKLLNDKYKGTAETEAACIGGDPKKCCVPNFQPKFKGFEATVGGVVLQVFTLNSSNPKSNSDQGFDLSSWPCAKLPFAEAVKNGDKFGALEAIFDIDFGTPGLYPATNADMPKYVDGPVDPDPTNPTSPTGQTGPTAPTDPTDPEPTCPAPPQHVGAPEGVDPVSQCGCECSGGCNAYECTYSCNRCTDTSCMFCGKCRSDADCGGEGNFCLADQYDDTLDCTPEQIACGQCQDLGRCGKYCTRDSDCRAAEEGSDGKPGTSGALCFGVWGEDEDSGETKFYGNNCFPENDMCE